MLRLFNVSIHDVSLALWQLSHDVVVLGNLRLALQRIARSHWQPLGTLRSWGHVPLHREADVLLAPCAQSEAIWLGCWLEEGEGPSRVVIIDPVSGYHGFAVLPSDFQIGVLHRSGSPDLPISLPTACAHRFRLELACIEKLAVIPFLLLSPLEWSERAARNVPEPLGQPPPLPPLLG